MNKQSYELGTIEASEQLIHAVYRLTQKSEPLGVHNASNGSSEDGVCRATSRQCCNGISRWSVRSKGQRFDFAER